MVEFTVEDFEKLGVPLENFAAGCHAASIHIVKSGVLGECRVARGSCKGVGGQHSWVVLGNDCYDKRATVVDATLWSYDKDVEGIWIGRANERPHLPHGAGSIWQWGRPAPASGPVIELDADFSREARSFLDLLGPLDREGWMMLGSYAPVEGWPAAEILAALDEVMPCVPIDRIGMLTDLNPGGLYLRGNLDDEPRSVATREP